MTRKTTPPVPDMEQRMARAGTRPHALHKPNADQVKHGIPKAFRRYAKRYGKGLLGLVATHLKNPAGKLDHGAERAAKKESGA